ncbi:MGH1-like glycoside hydrolase domain-containing protein [Algivirga pacifica]|uniref:Alpha-glucosidase n=1 Tax=Algivirga pacifica TaxID=1162670 RepID=A0ABP9DBG5_9BACT
MRTVQFSGILLALSACLFSCQKHSLSDYNYHRKHFKNILDLKGIPVTPQDEHLSSFSDLGSWHSFGLPKDSDKAAFGGFTGPFVMRQQESEWISPELLKLTLHDPVSGKAIALSEGKLIKNDFYPGILQQEIKVEDLKISLSLFFIDERTAFLKAKIHNQGEKRELQTSWKGKIFSQDDRAIRYKSKGLYIPIAKEEAVEVFFQEKGKLITSDSLAYHYQHTPFTLFRNGFWEESLLVRFTLSKEERKRSPLQTATILKQGDTFEIQNEERWDKYFKTLFKTHRKKALLSAQLHRTVAAKSLVTLIHNWRSAAGGFQHQGIVPSYAAKYFQGLWAWDSWKHAVAIAPFEPELAKDQIRAMYDYQNEEGMIADCFFRDPELESVNWRNTKAPLSGWAIYEVFTETGDSSFVRELYPQLKKYHYWWYTYRDHDQNGICEYGSTDGTRIAAAWESGMDNAVRFDSAVILNNQTKGAYSINQESIDLNAYLYQEKVYLTKLADILGITEDGRRYQKEAKELKEVLKTSFYHAKDGYFYDRRLKTKKPIRIQGPEGWAPLYNQIADKGQAEGVVKVMMDSSKFNTPIPFPTLSAAHPLFNPQKGYWRGPVWLDQAYFALKGMQYYGYKDEAIDMAEKLIEAADGLTSNKPIRENYHPISKQGLNAKHFSWSAAHLLMLFK